MLFCDAPPHGTKFGGGGDAFPNGCPCGLTEDEVLGRVAESGIHLSIINITSQQALAPMIEIFQKVYLSTRVSRLT